MKSWLVSCLACPACGSALLAEPSIPGDGEVRAGNLTCERCAHRYPVRQGIPRFVEQHYAGNFSLEWQMHSRTQFDRQGMTLSEDAFFRITKWDPAQLHGYQVLDAGCGSGRYSRVALKHGARVVGVDLSEAVDEAKSNLGEYDGFEVVQADLCAMPFPDGAFDRVFCIGVLQHTPHPYESLQHLLGMVKPGGSLALWFYGWNTPVQWIMDRLHMKRLLRPIVKHLPPATLYRFVRWYVPKLLPASRAVRRINPFRRLPIHEMTVPVANRDYIAGTSDRDKVELAVLDTFDWFSPMYDRLLSEKRVVAMLRSAGFDTIERTMQGGYTCCRVK